MKKHQFWQLIHSCEELRKSSAGRRARLRIARVPVDPHLSRQSGAGVIHGRPGGRRSAVGGHVEGAAMSLLGVRVSLGLGGRVCPSQLGGSGATGCHLVKVSKKKINKNQRKGQRKALNGNPVVCESGSISFDYQWLVGFWGLELLSARSRCFSIKAHQQQAATLNCYKILMLSIKRERCTLAFS